MRRRKSWVQVVVIGLWLALFCSSCSAAPEKPFYVDNPQFKGEHARSVAELREFFFKLQEAVQMDDEAWIAKNILYPITVVRSGKTIRIRNKDDLHKYYKVVVNKVIKQAVRCQKFDNLFVNWEGVMVGYGAIWFEKAIRVKVDVKEGGAAGRVTPAPESDVKKFSQEDASKWPYKIFALSDGDPVRQFVERCKQSK